MRVVGGRDGECGEYVLRGTEREEERDEGGG